MSEQMRKEFEDWIKKLNSVGKAELNSLKTTVNGDFYLNLNTEMLWQAWQASRAAIVVDTSSMPEASYGGTGVVYLSGVENALEKAGVSHK